MKMFIVPLLFLVFFCFSVSPSFSANSSYSIVMYRLKDGKTKEITENFTPDEKIYAEFTFLPEEREMGVQFRWLNPTGNKQQVDFELVKSTMPPEKRTVLYWIFLQSTLIHKFVGSRFFGPWRLEIWVNSRYLTHKAFKVGN
jgi:hypothetical protein